MAYGESSGYVTDDPKGHTCDPNTLRAQYLEYSWTGTCYLETIAILLDSLL